jgi:hypothetical protein
MTERSLQITYRKGKPFSASLHLSHQTGEKSARTVPSADGLLVIDYVEGILAWIRRVPVRTKSCSG